MSRKLIIPLLGALVIVGVVAYWLAKPIRSSDKPGAIELINLPDHYCPTTATLVATSSPQSKTVLSESNPTVVNCRSISLASIPNLSAGATVYFKLPRALAMRVNIDSLSGRYQAAPALGDMNDDDIIDSTDQQQVEAALLTTDAAQIEDSDLDQDGHVTVIDLALTRVNRRAGVPRPDGQEWLLK